MLDGLVVAPGAGVAAAAAAAAAAAVVAVALGCCLTETADAASPVGSMPPPSTLALLPAMAMSFSLSISQVKRMADTKASCTSRKRRGDGGAGRGTKKFSCTSSAVPAMDCLRLLVVAAAAAAAAGSPGGGAKYCILGVSLALGEVQEGGSSLSSTVSSAAAPAAAGSAAKLLPRSPMPPPQWQKSAHEAMPKRHHGFGSATGVAESWLHILFAIIPDAGAFDDGSDLASALENIDRSSTLNDMLVLVVELGIKVATLALLESNGVCRRIRLQVALLILCELNTGSVFIDNNLTGHARLLEPRSRLIMGVIDDEGVNVLKHLVIRANFGIRVPVAEG